MMTKEPITALLKRVRTGDEEARQLLWSILLPLLEQRAHQALNGNNVAEFVTTSDVLQGAIEQLLRREQLDFNDRQHLMGYAVTVMRHIIIDLARKHKPNQRRLVPVDEQLGLKINEDFSWIEVDEILNQLAELDPVKARIVELRAFADFTNEQIAEELGISLATIKRHLKIARAFIMGRMTAPKK